LKDGNAININIKAGLTVHISSTNVPWFTYLLDILLFLKLFTIDTIIQLTANNTIAK